MFISEVFDNEAKFTSILESILPAEDDEHSLGAGEKTDQSEMILSKLNCFQKKLYIKTAFQTFKCLKFYNFDY